MSYSGVRIVKNMMVLHNKKQKRSKLGIRNLNNRFPSCSDSRSTTVPVLLCTADHLKEICKTKSKLLSCKERQLNMLRELDRAETVTNVALFLYNSYTGYLIYM